MNRRALHAMLAIGALASVGGGLARRDEDGKPALTPEELAKELEAQKARQAEERKRREEYYARMEAAERARHPATRSKPKSESLERLLGRRRRRP